MISQQDIEELGFTTRHIEENKAAYRLYIGKYGQQEIDTTSTRYYSMCIYTGNSIKGQLLTIHYVPTENAVKKAEDQLYYGCIDTKEELISILKLNDIIK
jgi:hypothetical protein